MRRPGRGFGPDRPVTRPARAPVVRDATGPPRTANGVSSHGRGSNLPVHFALCEIDV